MIKNKKRINKKLYSAKLFLVIVILCVAGSLGLAYGLNRHPPVQSPTAVLPTKTVTKSAHHKKAKSKPAQKTSKKPAQVSKAVVSVVTRAPKPQPVVRAVPNSKVDTLKPTKVATPSHSAGSSGGSAGSSSGSNQVTSGYSSTNWSGYLATGKKFTSVSGSWAVPSVTGNGSTQTADGTWIGIGGVTSGDLIQVGTENTVSASGVVSSSIFYELLPASATLVASVPIKAGDNISANITQQPNSQWNISITNTATNKNYTKVVSYSSSYSTAEWIQEDPSYANGSLVPLTNFGTVNFWAASTVASAASYNLNSANALPIRLVTMGGQSIAVPSFVGPDGASFSVTHL